MWWPVRKILHSSRRKQKSYNPKKIIALCCYPTGLMTLLLLEIWKALDSIGRCLLLAYAEKMAYSLTCSQEPEESLNNCRWHLNLAQIWCSHHLRASDCPSIVLAQLFILIRNDRTLCWSQIFVEKITIHFQLEGLGQVLALSCGNTMQLG